MLFSFNRKASAFSKRKMAVLAAEFHHFAAAFKQSVLAECVDYIVQLIPEYLVVKLGTIALPCAVELAAASAEVHSQMTYASLTKL